MLRPSALVLAAVFSSRAFWLAFVEHSLPVATAVIWFLVAIPVCAVALAGLDGLLTAYRRSNAGSTSAASGAAETDDAT
jgi:hypothetical protein